MSAEGVEPMESSDHYAKAVALLESAEESHSPAAALAIVAKAQVHAILALGLDR